MPQFGSTPRMLTTSVPSSPVFAPLQQLTYDYNAAGYVKLRQSNSPATVEQFQTDGLGRLKYYEVEGTTGLTRSENYFYTAGGDISSVTKTALGTNETEQYTYEPARPHLISSRAGFDYQHDNNGSQISRSGPDIPNGQQTLEYNDLPMPWRITSGTDVTTLEYDASGTRVAKRNDWALTTIYFGDLYDCTNLSGGLPSSPFVCSEHHYKVYAGSQLVAQVTRDSTGATTQTRYIHPDLLGSTTTVTDELGAVAEQRQFDAFGNTTSDFGRIRAGYTGQEQDPELGLINMKGRLYDPALRRFTTADPYVTEPLNPQGLNRYSYVQNNPMNFTDPSGFEEYGYDEYNYSQQMSNYYSQQAEIQANIARFAFSDYMINLRESGPATPPTNVPSIEQIAQWNNEDPTQSSAVNWGQFNEMANQASARGMAQAQAQNVQMGDVMRAHDVAFTTPYTLTTPGTPMSYQTMMGFTGTTYGSNPYYPTDPVMNGFNKAGDFLFLDNVRTLADPNASAGERVAAGIGLAITFLPVGEAVGLGVRTEFKFAERVGGQLADSRLGPLAGKISTEQLQDLASNPNALRFFDTATGNTNTIQLVEGRLLRITTAGDDITKIISVGPIQRNGRFTPLIP